MKNECYSAYIISGNGEIMHECIKNTYCAAEQAAQAYIKQNNLSDVHYCIEETTLDYMDLEDEEEL